MLKPNMISFNNTSEDKELMQAPLQSHVSKQSSVGGQDESKLLGPGAAEGMSFGGKDGVEIRFNN